MWGTRKRPVWDSGFFLGPLLSTRSSNQVTGLCFFSQSHSLPPHQHFPSISFPYPKKQDAISCSQVHADIKEIKPRTCWKTWGQWFSMFPVLRMSWRAWEQLDEGAPSFGFSNSTGGTQEFCISNIFPSQGNATGSTLWERLDDRLVSLKHRLGSQMAYVQVPVLSSMTSVTWSKVLTLFASISPVTMWSFGRD